ncbi:ComEA family DNA-binding protein [Lentiprolixibacter aurantiacus]|uniref:Helix-hairpin-helix domain-containing protein n=1 Tax=Lentiprolixibacter aurantiacus TaxID=2993939 RepID=A0AAE3SN38_9FLAO|nr:helix-hairpin-helix domain-containing protein [Lentiprolixibacter aurantiacus]MCX2719322.1 helix-hairpin-helix domain-containing protein [Lentiprolixibacter aurantiacus]
MIIFLLQGFRYFLLKAPPKEPDLVLEEHPSAVRWLDSLRTSAGKDDRVFSYNPNFLTDYQAYMLRITPEETDRIFAYRAAGKWIHSEEDFWTISKIGEDRRSTIASRLRFKSRSKMSQARVEKAGPNELPKLRDINQAEAAELMEIKGIGPVLSERIVKFRNRLGGFQVSEQLFDVYGLDPEVVNRLLHRYAVLEKPELERININQASADKIASLIYLSRKVARRIVEYRELNGPFVNLGELTKIEDFPSDKIDRISLYLSL